MSQVPRTLDEAIEALIEINLKPDEINSMWVRNNWGLWSGGELAQWFYAHQIYHADDMSGIINESYERRINSKPLELDLQIQKYHKHWEKCYGKNHLEKMRKDVIGYIVNMRNEKIDKIVGKE